MKRRTASNATIVENGALNMFSTASVISGMAASRIEWSCRRIHTLARGHVMGRGIVDSACSVTAYSSIIGVAAMDVYN